MIISDRSSSYQPNAATQFMDEDSIDGKHQNFKSDPAFSPKQHYLDFNKSLDNSHKADKTARDLQKKK